MHHHVPTDGAILSQHHFGQIASHYRPLLHYPLCEQADARGGRSALNPPTTRPVWCVSHLASYDDTGQPPSIRLVAQLRADTARQNTAAARIRPGWARAAGSCPQPRQQLSLQAHLHPAPGLHPFIALILLNRRERVHPSPPHRPAAPSSAARALPRPARAQAARASCSRASWLLRPIPRSTRTPHRPARPVYTCTISSIEILCIDLTTRILSR